MSRRATLHRLKSDFGDLLAVHEQARDLTEFAGYADDPVAFTIDVLQASLTDYQERIAESVRDRPLVVVQSCNAAGKDFIAAHLALWFVYARRGLVLITGPTQRQVREIVMGEVGRAWGRARDLPGELFQSALRLGQVEQAGIIAFTSTEASRLTGFHAPRLMVLLTEAQGVESFAWEAALACATGSQDRILAVGNPLSPSGSFYAACRSDAWHRHQIGAFETPNVQQGREVFPGMMTLQGVARIEGEFGKGSGIYQARVLGEFPDQGEESLLRRSWLEAAAERLERWRKDHAASEPILAVDVGRQGPDATVCAVLRGPVVTRIEAWGGADLMETVDRVRTLAAEEGARPGGDGSGVIVVDVVGLGAGVADRLVELSYRVVEFNGGTRAWDPQRFANTRAESYWVLRDALEMAALALPPDEELLEELLAQTWTPTAEGRIALPPKETIKGQLGRSPNKADAVTMGVWWQAVAATPAPWSEVVLGPMGDPCGFFAENGNLVIDEDREAGWEPVRW